MTLLQLTYALELSHYQSFSLTAKKLNISQPALSIQMSKLEEELGMQIFDRTQGTISLTFEGAIFIEKTRELIQLTENLKNLPFELEHKPEGELTIGIIPTLAPYWVPLFMNNFNKQFNKIRITIKELKTEEIIKELKTGQLDAGFISTPVQASGLKFQALFYEQFYLYVSEKHELFSHDRIHIDEVDLKEMWYLLEGNCFQNQVDAVCIYAKEPGEFQNMVYLSDSIESLCRVVDLAGGITFIPELATLSVPPNKEDMIKEIAGEPPLREISLVTNKITKGNRLINLFIEKAMEVIPSRMKNNRQGKAIDPHLKF